MSEKHRHRSKKDKEEYRDDTPPSPPKSISTRVNGGNFELVKFNPAKQIRPGTTCLFAGGRRTGKSFAMRDFIYNLRSRFYDMSVISGTSDFEYPWEKFTPEKYVFYANKEADFPEDKMQEILTRQEKRVKIAEEHGVPCPFSLIVLEDMGFLRHSMWTEQSLRFLMYNGRHYKTYGFAAIQYLMEIKMGCRGMFDFAVFTMEPSAAVRKRIWEQFASVFPKYSDFEKVFMACTRDHGCMVVDCKPTSYNLSDIVFWYKAEDHGIFPVGVNAVRDPEVDKRNVKKYGTQMSGNVTLMDADAGDDE